MDVPEPDYYVDLGISPSASQIEIKRAYHRLAIIHHPDKKAPGQAIDAAKFRQIQTAYEFLSDPYERAEYDLRYARVQRRWTQYREHQKAEEERRAAAEASRVPTPQAREASLIKKIWKTAEKQFHKEARFGQLDKKLPFFRTRTKEQVRRREAASEARRKRTEDRARQAQAKEDARRREAEEQAQQAREEEEEDEEYEEDEEEDEEDVRRVRRELVAEFVRYELQQLRELHQQRQQQQTPPAAKCPHPPSDTVLWPESVTECAFCRPQPPCYWCSVCNTAVCQRCKALLLPQ